jgi:hypothetical protein
MKSASPSRRALVVSRLARVPAVVGRRRARGLYSIHLQSGTELPRDGDGADRLRAAAHGDHDGIQVGLLLDDLQGHGPGAGDHPGVVRGVGHRRPLVADDPLGHLERFVVVTTFLDDARAEGAHGGVLLGIVA